MMPATTHFVTWDWHKSPEGREILKSVTERHSPKRKVFGLLERPSFPPQMLPDEFRYKIFVSGRTGVGKTSTVAKLTGNQIPENPSETPGIQTSTVYWPAKMADIDKIVMFHLQFWDAGENALKKFDHVLPACKEKTDGVLFLFSFTDKTSFDDIPQQMSRILESSDSVCRFVIGTKLDLHAKSEITQRHLQEFEQQWRLPVLTMKNVADHSENVMNEINDVAPVLNYICDQLWLRDGIMAGRIQPPDVSNNEAKITFC